MCPPPPRTRRHPFASLTRDAVTPASDIKDGLDGPTAGERRGLGAVAASGTRASIPILYGLALTRNT